MLYDVGSMGFQRIDRLARCATVVPTSLHFSDANLLNDSSNWVSITSSRLGRDPLFQRAVCQFLSRRMLDLRQQNASVLVAAGSAIEPLAIRAAELFRVPVVRLAIDGEPLREAPSVRTCVVRSTDATELSRDELQIAIAERVDAIHVRKGGKIAAILEKRIKALNDASTRIAIINGLTPVISNLIRSGAIGWYLSRPESNELSDGAEKIALSTTEDNHWTRSEGQWLTHSTRASSGPWPGETQRQYQDALLLGAERLAHPSALDCLARIVRTGVLVANAHTSCRDYPVVCFSEASLEQRLCSRTFRSHVGRWDGEPYGIAIRINAAKRLGIQPVLYGEPKDRNLIAPEDQYRFAAKGKTFDWTLEREWRANHSLDLTQFEDGDVKIFVACTEDVVKLNPLRPWPITVVGKPLDQTRLDCV